MATTMTVGNFALLGFLWLMLATSLTSPHVSAEEQLSLVVSKYTTLQVIPSTPVDKSPGSKPGTKLFCERVWIHGLPRIQNLKRFVNSVKVKVLLLNTTSHLPKVEVCFHRNGTLGIGLCAQEKWEKVSNGLWIGSMSPYDHKLLDVRTAGSASECLQVSVEEEFFLFRVVFMMSGVILMALAPWLSKSLAFYYSGAMTVGILLVILMVLFQGMKLLPTGRKSSLAIFVYSSIVGFGSFLLRYVPRLLRSVLVEMGLGDDLYNPLMVFLLLSLVISGAWLGFWVVRKLVLTEDGSIDVNVAHFVAWAIRIFASVLILQSSVDVLLAFEALMCAILLSLALRRFTRMKFVHRLLKKLSRMDKDSRGKVRGSHTSEFIKEHGSTVSPRAHTSRASTSKSPAQLSDSGEFYSTFHKTSVKRNFSKGEWETFSRESTRMALEGLVSSPEFSQWAVAHADRITLAPKRETNHRLRWFHWF